MHCKQTSFAHATGKKARQLYKQSMSKGLQPLINRIYFFESKLLMYHWNVTGMDFLSYHKFFEEAYKEMAEHKDYLAEHLRYEKTSVIIDYSSLSKLAERFSLPSRANEMLKDALSEYNFLIAEYNKLEKDMMLDAIISDIVKELEKRVYILQSILETNQ